MFAADILRKEKAVFEQNKAVFCEKSAKLGIKMSENDIIAAYDTAIALLEKRDDDNRTSVSVHRVWNLYGDPRRNVSGGGKGRRLNTVRWLSYKCARLVVAVVLPLCRVQISTHSIRAGYNSWVDT